MNKQLLNVIKIGGAILDNPLLIAEFISLFKGLSGHKILVHGGGDSASSLQKSLNIKITKIDGRRVTDAATLKAIVMTYAGLLNKTLVASLQANCINAIGLTGADGNLIRARKRVVTAIDYGFVGDIQEINSSLLSNFIAANLVPVFAAVTHDKEGQLLNTNADTLAAQIAIAMNKIYHVRYYNCFTKPGVLNSQDDANSVIENLDYKEFDTLKLTKQITDGMLPKLETSFEAFHSGIDEVRLGSIHMLREPMQIHTKLCL